MKQHIRRALFALAPQTAAAIVSARSRALSHRLLTEWGCTTANRTLFERLGHIVLDGPFKGLVLTPSVQAEQAGPYLLGLYEREIHPAWEIVFRSTYGQIVDVGAKFGYYAVGLARKYPDAAIIAFDTDRWARRALREVARQNGCTNVTIRGFCTREWLARHVRPGALIVSDCEGYEVALMLPEPVASMRSATLVLEAHDHAEPGTSERLRAAFAATHEVHTFTSESTRPVPAALDFLPPEQRLLAVLEVRSTTVWLLCVPRERRH